MKAKHLNILPIPFGIACMCGGIAFAADAPAGRSTAATGLEEVIVTARKTEESAQQVPVSVAAFTGEALTQAAITDIKDVRVPGLYITSDTQYGYATFAIRAAKQANGTGDPVTAYVGDVPVANNFAISHMMYDMQSISVLKGPQGTLFGANSTGGAIIFRPNTPSDELEGYADIGYGNYDLKSFQGMINVPVNDVLQLRLAGEVVDRDEGYVKNHPPSLGDQLFPNPNTDLDTDKHESARLGIRFKPSDAWENNFTFEYYHENDQPHPEVPAALLPPFVFGGFAPVDWQSGGGFIVDDPNDVSFGGTPSDTFRKAEIWDAIWVADYKLSNGVALKSVLGYQDYKLDYSIDNDATGWSVVNGRTSTDIKMWTWEPSVDWSADGGRLRNKTGLFFSDKKQDNGNSYALLYLPYDPAIRPFTNTIFPTSGHQSYSRDFESRAVYTQFAYDLSDQLTATVGLRYSWDEGDYSSIDKQSVGLQYLPTQGQFTSDDPSQRCTYRNPGYASFDPVACSAKDDYKSEAGSWTVTLENKLYDSSMVYATARGGYLLGGFNNQISAASAPFGLFPTYRPEKVVDFEIGLKSDWELLSRPIRTNLAAFYGNYKDQQRIVNGNINGTNFIGTVNAGASTFYGFDLEVVYVPADNLELTASWNHIETEYTKYENFIAGAATIDGVSVVGAALDLSDEELSQAPNDVVNVSATYTWPTPAAAGEISSTLGYYWTAATVAQDVPQRGCAAVSGTTCTSFPAVLDFTSFDEVPSYSLWNFTTQWKGIVGSNFDVNVWVKNLADKEYWTSTSNQMLVFGYATRIYGAPRTYGVNLRYSF